MEHLHFEHDGHTHEISVDTDTSLGRDIAKLHYFCHHNASHIAELEALKHRFREEGLDKTVSLLEEGLDLLKKSNHLLEHAIESAQEV